MVDITSFVRAIPKADIHVHFEGLVTRGLFEELRNRNGIPDDLPSSAIFRDSYGNLDEFIAACRAANTVIRTERDCFEIVCEYLGTCSRDNVLHVELAFEPEFHMRRGLSYEAVTGGISRGLEFGRTELGISYCLILSLARDLPEDVAIENLECARRHPVKIDAVGLASRELGNPPTRFRRVFERARQSGYRLVMHAGEEGPVSYVWQALQDIGVDRIDHGVRAVEDPKLISVLARCQTPIALCPISNLKTGNMPEAHKHPLGKMYRSGLLVSINSDDPGILQASLTDNYVSAAKEASLLPQDLLRLARNSILSSFMSKERKNSILGYVDRRHSSALEVEARS